MSTAEKAAFAQLTSQSAPRTNQSSSAPSAIGGALQLKASLRGHDFATQVQMLAPENSAHTPDKVQAAAARGIGGSGGALPHGDRIQRSFGGYDLSNVQAHSDAAATSATAAMGADAYATGNHVALGQGGQDLHTVAHEAAHVVQQRHGVSLSGGVGTTGDPYEQHADAVADLVVQGKSAEGLLGQMAGGVGEYPGHDVQMSVDPVGAAIAAAAFAMQVAPQTSAGLAHQNVLTRYVRDNAQDANTANARTTRIPILKLWTNMAASNAEASFDLVLRSDGDSIFAANTELGARDGFVGGVFGSSASVIWSATPYSGPRERPTSILLTCQGHCDPAGPGFADYRMSLIVKGDGTIIRQGAAVTNVSGNIRKTMAVASWGSGYIVRSMLRDDADRNQEQPPE